MGKLNFAPLKGLLCFLIGHLFHARPITFKNVCGPHTIASLCPVIFSLPFGFQYLLGLSQVSSSFLTADEASNAAERMQGGVFHSGTPVRCSNVVCRPKREPDQIRGVAEGSLNTPDASISESLHLGGGKIRGSSEVCQRGGRSPASPGRRSSGAGRSRREGVSHARASRHRPQAPGSGESSDAAPSTAGTKGIRAPKSLRPRSRRRRCC